MYRRLVFSFFTMLVLPLISLIQGLVAKDVKYKRWVIVLFICFYGSVIQLQPGTDGYVHQNRVNNYYSEISFQRFLLDLTDIFTFTTNPDLKGDLYIHLVSYLVGGVLGAPGLFFIIISFVYGYFYTGTLFKIIRLVPSFKYSWLFYGFMTIFVVYKGIEGINTVRTWTGLWVLIYACIRFYETKNLKYVVLMFTPPLIHVSYFVMAIPAWIVVFGGNWPRIYAVLFFLSFSFNLINPASVTQRLEETELGAEKVRGYSVEEESTVGERIEVSQGRGSNFYKVYAKAGFHTWAISFIALVLIIKGYYFTGMTYLEARLFSIGILTKVLSSSSWFLYALSNRSAVVAAIFILAAFILMAQRGAFNDEFGRFKRFEKITFTLIFIFFSPFLILKFSELGDFMSLYLLSSPFLVWFSSDLNMSLKEGLKILIGF